MIMIVGNFLPAAAFVPFLSSSSNLLLLPTSWQLPSLLLCSLTCGPKAGVIASIAYLVVGLFHIPIFHAGGSLEYLSTPAFSYLTGFIPAAWVSGFLVKQKKMNDLIGLVTSAIIGVITLHLYGAIALTTGALFSSWSDKLSTLLYMYSLGPLPTQILLCTAVGVIALPIRLLLLIE